MDPDLVLIRNMKQGEEAAFELFVRKYYREILVYCGYRLRDRACAEDITQETFVRFFAKLSDYHHRGKAKSYLYTIAGNLCKDQLRKAKEVPAEETLLNGKPAPEQHPMEDVLNRIIIERALQELPDAFREVITLYYFQELKLTEISGILHIGLPLVKYRLKQAKLRLEKILQEEENCGSEGTADGI